MSDTGSSGPVPVLERQQARVLGCLIEKEATTPDVYPLTVNATHAATNQKTARDPVMTLTPGDVAHSLRQLEQLSLVRQVFSSRAERYEHRTAEVLDLPRPQVALLGVLLLRGVQTAYELLARSERMYRFADVEDVRHHLDRLSAREPALVVVIPKGPGQREDRYAHLLSGAVDVASLSAIPSRDSVSAAPTGVLESRVEALETEVAQLREELAALQANLVVREDQQP